MPATSTLDVAKQLENFRANRASDYLSIGHGAKVLEAGLADGACLARWEISEIDGEWERPRIDLQVIAEREDPLNEGPRVSIEKTTNDLWSEYVGLMQKEGKQFLIQIWMEYLDDGAP